MNPGATARVLAALAGASFLALGLNAACEPQEIYLFDPAPLTVPEDSGAPVNVPTRPDPPDAYEPPPYADPKDAGPARVQPACTSPACAACVYAGDCDVDGAPFFCHPETAKCSLPCDADAPLGQAGNCPAPERCDPRLALCVECVLDSDCRGPLICDRSSGTCVECNADADCALGQLCLLGPQRCAECRNDADCAGRDDDILCLPGEQRCVECVEDGDCPDPERPFCSTERECEDERE